MERLLGVVGEEGRKNDALLWRGTEPSAGVVVYLGGDIQDFPEAMAAHRDNYVYAERWGLAAVGERILRPRFPRSHILVLRPARMRFGTFAIYSNFVKMTGLGIPEHTRDFGSLPHLEKLLESALGPSSKEVTLIGFSKGCVVLNQIAREIAAAPADSPRRPFISRLREWYWVDAGHQGGGDTWLTEERLLRPFLSALHEDARFHVHVSPYQISDTNRPWIREEEKAFSNFVSGNVGPARYKRAVHFQHEEATLEKHFSVLDVFLNS